MDKETIISIIPNNTGIQIGWFNFDEKGVFKIDYEPIIALALVKMEEQGFSYQSVGYVDINGCIFNEGSSTPYACLMNPLNKNRPFFDICGEYTILEMADRLAKHLHDVENKAIKQSSDKSDADRRRKLRDKAKAGGLSFIDKPKTGEF